MVMHNMIELYLRYSISWQWNGLDSSYILHMKETVLTITKLAQITTYTGGLEAIQRHISAQQVPMFSPFAAILIMEIASSDCIIIIGS